MKSKPSKHKYLPLPRAYLSWSALQLFRRDKAEYIRHYVYGEPREFTSPFMDFGSMFAEYLENRRKRHPDPVVDMIVKNMPRIGRPECEIRAEMPSKQGIIRLLGKCDQYDVKTHDFNEYKTGKGKWTNGKANGHGQMKFYQLMLWLKYGVTANKKNLIWVETEDENGDVRPTGKIQTYPVEIKVEDLLTFANEIKRDAIAISEIYQKEINQNI